MKQREPMGVKMGLARRIVADFHSEAEAAQAEEDFNREVRQGGEPADIETVAFPEGAMGASGVNVPKYILGTNLARSRTEAERLVKAGAVRFNGKRVEGIVVDFAPGTILTANVGKKWNRSEVPGKK